MQDYYRRVESSLKLLSKHFSLSHIVDSSARFHVRTDTLTQFSFSTLAFFHVSLSLSLSLTISICYIFTLCLAFDAMLLL